MKILLNFYEKNDGHTFKVITINKEQLKLWFALVDELDLEYLLEKDGRGITISNEDECKYIDLTE